MVSIIIITHNRIDFFRKCLESVISTTENTDREIILWDNASTDGTKELINETSGSFSFIKPVLYDKNIGVNAKGLAFELSKGEFIACLDDDVLELPDNWVEKMISAFHLDNYLGYLALDVVRNEHTTGAKLDENEYREIKYSDGTILQTGPAGGWCFMIPRNVYNTVGKFRQIKNKVFFGEDGDYIIRCRLNGFHSAILKDVKCFHATGPYYNKNYMEIFNNKMKDFNSAVIDSHTVKLKTKQIINKIKRMGKER